MGEEIVSEDVGAEDLTKVWMRIAATPFFRWGRELGRGSAAYGTEFIGRICDRSEEVCENGEDGFGPVHACKTAVAGI